MPRIRMEGLNELRAKLNRDASMTEAKKIVKMNGAELQLKAQRRAPVDTGNLKRSIGLEITDAGNTATVEPTADYAPYLEYGTRFMEAQPYMRPSYNEQKEIFKHELDMLVR